MLVGADWSTDLYGRLTTLGLIGTRLMDFTDAVGKGSVNHVVGKPFVTTDTGLTIGAGVGTGVGLSGFAAPDIATSIFTLAFGAFGYFGIRLQDICDAIGQSCVAQMALATLTSTHTPVFLGVGIVNPGSVGVTQSGWGSSVQSEGNDVGFIGSRWPDFASAIGAGQGIHVGADATGSVAITGVWSGLPPLPPGGTPGVGVGAGTIS